MRVTVEPMDSEKGYLYIAIVMMKNATSISLHPLLIARRMLPETSTRRHDRTKRKTSTRLATIITERSSSRSSADI